MAQRIFFALLPDAAAKSQIITIQQQFTNPQLRIYSESNLHQTLVFLGEFAEADLMSLITACQSIHLPPVNMQYEQLIFWPQPKVLCLLASSVPNELQVLVQALNKIARLFNVSPDPRPYRPHITLARKANQAIELDFTPVRFTADEFVLMQSVSTAGGPVYQRLYSWPLKMT